MGVTQLEIDWDYLLERVERLIDLGEAYLAQTVEGEEVDPDLFVRAAAFRWQTISMGGGGLRPLVNPEYQALDELVGLAAQVAVLRNNTRQFVVDIPSHHVLIQGGRGQGKTALVRGLLPEFVADGLRIVELRNSQLEDVEQLVRILEDVPLRFILLCEDLRLANRQGLEALSLLLNPGVEGCPANIRIYATLAPQAVDEDALTELQGYFGVHLQVTELNEPGYLTLVEQFVEQFDCPALDNAAKQAALRWAEQCGCLTGRVAQQFAIHYAGPYWRAKLESPADAPAPDTGF